ncbi:MAG: hypothetical protein SV186_03570 [Candidatus Nanohaloarchaea archaeon]|nr:hypothetical protein [Candidatus Nanohaloarchaea archaeon]
MATKDELKEAAEELSEQEFERLKLLKRIAQLVDDLDISEVNDLPALYRLEIKKALEELGNEQAASKVET